MWWRLPNRPMLVCALAVLAEACGAKTGLLAADRDGARTVDAGGAGLTGRGGVAGVGGAAVVAVSGAGVGGAGVPGVGGVGSVDAAPACTPIAIPEQLINDFENGDLDFTSPSGIPQNWYQSTIVGEEWTLVFERPNPPRPSAGRYAGHITREERRHLRRLLSQHRVGCARCRLAGGRNSVRTLHGRHLSVRCERAAGIQLPVVIRTPRRHPV